MIDPANRWAAYGEKPDYAGLLTFSGFPYTEDPAELAGVDVAIVGAPMDDLTSDAPGTRFGPRAIRAASCPPGPHMESKVDATDVLRVVDFGDAPVVPALPERSHEAIEATVGQVLAAGALPIVLGGGHPIAPPHIPPRAPVHGLVESGHVDGRRYVQIGLRGYWPGETEFAWQREKGITSLPMHEIRDRGIRAVVEDALAAVGAGPTFVSVDVDVLDPAFAPGTGTPEPGGMTSADLLWACREIASRVRLVGADVVEVLPSRVGSADITALVGDRIVREILTGFAQAAGSTPIESGRPSMVAAESPPSP